jgi:predicted DCC family thiol-disulfide oxidoreductase YuxK
MISASIEDELQDEGELDAAAPGGRKARSPRWVTRSRFIAALVAGAIIWAVFAWGVVPKLISDAYEGHGISLLVKELEHKHAHSLDHYLGKWNNLALRMLGAWLVGGGIILMTTSRWFAKHVARTATPGTLGAIRMVICLIMAWVMYWTRLREIAPLPASQRIHMGVMDFFYAIGLAQIVHSVAAMQFLKWLCIALCLVGAAGFKTRIVLPLIAILYLPLQGITRSYFWFNHCGVIPFYCLMVLCLVRSGDGWSIDRLIRVWRGQDVPRADVATSYYGWARLAVWLCVCIPYMMAGMSKLRYGTLMWWDANNMQYILFADGLRPGGETLAMQLLWLPGWFFALMGIGTIITEIGFITVPFWRVSRMVLPIAMFGMHMGIWTVMGINFYDLLIIQVIFYDWSPLRRWVAARLAARRGTITVLFDGNCPLCQRTIRTVRAMDIFSRLNVVDFRTANLAALAGSHGVTLDAHRLEREMVVIRNGQSYGGARGARVIAGALPALWLVWPLLAIPGLSHVAAAVYRTVARNRMGLVKCDPSGTACAVPDTREPGKSLDYAKPPFIGGWPKSLRGGIAQGAVAGMFIFMLSIWLIRVEWYPFTGMQMFSNYAKTSVVSYYRAYVFYEDGTSEIAQFEKMYGGIARYRPVLEAPFLYTATAEYREKGRKACIEFMARSAANWNAANPPPGKRVVRIEAHHKNWDFVTQRHDRENWGTTVEKVVYEVKPNADTRLASGTAQG